MMTSTRNQRFALLVASSAALLVTALPLAAHAQRVSPLADAPAIRKRVELRDSRFEGGVGFGSTIGQDYFHTLFVNLKLDYHINDWLSIGAVGGLGVANIETAYADRLLGSFDTTRTTTTPPRDPTRDEAAGSMQKIKTMLAAQLEFTPFTGKFGLGGKIFAHYDFYLFAGGSALDVEPANTAIAACSSTGTSTSCGISGFKPGGTFGFGLHAFFKQWVGLNLEARDVLARINPSGRDINGDGVARSDDVAWGSTFMFAANLVFYLPATAAISP